MNYQELHLRKHPDLYTVHRPHHGVLMLDPYKPQILPHSRFNTPQIPTGSSHNIYHLFFHYNKNPHFLPIHIPPKFLQMG
ncbi:DUF4385 family protein, partial [Paenibacillus xylanexedens]|uniref:DUF4385 family protein n=1 Tax=Paenibacillus xylanexedens TaxID=528191 RepID=UPI0034D97F64